MPVAVVVAALILAAGAAGSVWLAGSRRRLLSRMARRRVAVTLKDGTGFDGILWQVDRDVLVLRNVRAHDVPDQGTVPVDGELVLLRPDVLYLQLP